MEIGVNYRLRRIDFDNVSVSIKEGVHRRKDSIRYLGLDTELAVAEREHPVVELYIYWFNQF